MKNSTRTMMQRKLLNRCGSRNKLIKHKQNYTMLKESTIVHMYHQQAGTKLL